MLHRIQPSCSVHTVSLSAVYHTRPYPLYKSYPTVCLLSQGEWAFQVHELSLNKGLVFIHMLMVWFSSKIPDFIWEWAPSAVCNSKIYMFLPVWDANLMSPSWKGYKGWGCSQYWQLLEREHVNVCSFALCQWGDQQLLLFGESTQEAQDRRDRDYGYQQS